MTHCRQEVFQFQGLKSRKVTVDFKGGYLSSDGGALFLCEAELRYGIIRKLSKCFVDTRNQYLIEHGLEELLAQRVNALPTLSARQGCHRPTHIIGAARPQVGKEHPCSAASIGGSPTIYSGQGRGPGQGSGGACHP